MRSKTYRRFRTEFKLGVVEAYLAGELALDLHREVQLVKSDQHVAALERRVGQLTMQRELL